jgi:hypothetical protein
MKSDAMVDNSKKGSPFVTFPARLEVVAPYVMPAISGCDSFAAQRNFVAYVLP